MDIVALLKDLGVEAVSPAAALGNGEWLRGEGRLASENPTTGEVLAETGTCTPRDYEAVVDGAVRAAALWAAVPAPARGQVVRAIADELRQRKDALGNLIALEVGKIKSEADGEVQEMIDIADFAVGLSRMLHGRSMPSERACHRLFEQWHPLGVVGVVTAFNFPAAVWAWNAFIAAVCGDVVVWKPSPKAPLTAVAVQKLVERVLCAQGHAGVFSLLLSAGPDLGRRLAADPRLALVSFTGSSAAGREVAQIVAGRFGRCLLECSGNNAVIVDACADLDVALPAIVFGAVGTAGQRCTTTRRLIVHASRFEEIVRRLVGAYSQVRIGDPFAPDTLMGPLIDEAAARTFEGAVAEARRMGAQVLYGGRRLPGSGHFVEPTVVKSRNEWPVVQRETFAPILHVMEFDRLDEAIALQNAVPQGLSSAMFTLDLRHAEAFLSAQGSDCGIANVNVGTSGAEIGGAFGGEKETGGGREAGSDAWKAYMRRQTVTVNWGSDLPLAQGIRFRTAPGG